MAIHCTLFRLSHGCIDLSKVIEGMGECCTKLPFSLKIWFEIVFRVEKSTKKRNHLFTIWKRDIWKSNTWKKKTKAEFLLSDSPTMWGCEIGIVFDHQQIMQLLKAGATREVCGMLPQNNLKCWCSETPFWCFERTISVWNHQKKISQEMSKSGFFLSWLTCWLGLGIFRQNWENPDKMGMVGQSVIWSTSSKSGSITTGPNCQAWEVCQSYCQSKRKSLVRLF